MSPLNLTSDDSAVITSVLPRRAEQHPPHLASPLTKIKQNKTKPAMPKPSQEPEAYDPNHKQSLAYCPLSQCRVTVLLLLIDTESENFLLNSLVQFGKSGAAIG